MINSKDYIFSLIERKGNIKIDQISSYDQSKLSSAKCYLDGLKRSFAEFYEVFKSQGLRVPIHRYTEQQAAEVQRNTKCYGEAVFGWLPNGWILADENVYFYFGNEHDFHASYLYMSDAEWVKVKKFFSSNCSFKSPAGLYIGIECAQMDTYKLFFQELYKAKSDWVSVISEISNQVESLIIPVKSNLDDLETTQGYDSKMLVEEDIRRAFIERVKNATVSLIWDVSKRDFQNADLSSMDLRGGKFESCNLREADLRYSDISYSDFWLADLTYADLRGVKMNGRTSFMSAKLMGANLSGLDFYGVSLHGADLSGADLTGASLVGASISNAKFYGADLTGVKGYPK